jgi:hypothetical protein
MRITALLVDSPFDAIELTSDATDLLKQLALIAERNMVSPRVFISKQLRCETALN